MSPIELSHFTAALIFALCASVVFAITQKNTPKEMLHYGSYCFGLFVGGVVLASWVMWLLKR